MRLALALCGLACAAGPAAASAHDYDRDGREDLFAGLPGWDVGVSRDVGAGLVIGGVTRRHAPAARLLTESLIGSGDGSVWDDRFGESVAGGDFDGDGYADLAIGAPGGRGGGLTDIGTATVLYGSPSGLAGAARTVITGPVPPSGITRRSYVYGKVLAAGDLDGDGFDDLVSSVQRDPPPGVDIDAGAPGALVIVFGSRTGLDRARTRTLPGPAGGDVVRSDLREFGAALAVGDVNRDGYADIAEAAPGEPFDLDGGAEPGHVGYCPGRAGGPVACRLREDFLYGAPAALAIGDVDGDGYGDIVGGSPHERLWGELEREPAGGVRIWRGSRHGPRGPRLLRQGSGGVKGRGEPGDLFGAAVAVADRQIAVGAPGEDRGAGRVTVIRGTHSAVYDQGHRRRGRVFGAALAFLDFDGDGRKDLAVGAPGAGGSVTVLRGARHRFKTTGARVIRTRTFGIPTAPDIAFGGRLGP
jgi:hypothetical protein